MMDSMNTPSVNMPAGQIERVHESRASVEAHTEPYSARLIKKRRRERKGGRRYPPDTFETEDGRQSEAESGPTPDVDDPGTVIDIKA
jgi:hypothetical protein